MQILIFPSVGKNKIACILSSITQIFSRWKYVLYKYVDKMLSKIEISWFIY